MRITSDEIRFIINETLDGVEKSNIGGVFLKDANGELKRDGHGSPIFTLLGSTVFMVTLDRILIREIGGY